MVASRGSNNKYRDIQSSRDDYYTPNVRPVPIPAPLGGLDAISPLANMPPQYAVTLNNWFPRPGWVELRGGYNAWCQNLGGASAPVNSLMVYRPAGGNERMFAASGTSIYEVTNNGVPTLSNSGLSIPSEWQYVNFTPAGGATYLVACNGANSVINFNGTSWSTPSITNVTSSNLINVSSHQRRLWFVEQGTTHVWYLATDAIQGAATLLDVGPFLTKGSYVTGTTTWTVDASGSGPAALFVIMSNKGQCVIYQGSDPTSASAWSLVGVFDLPVPIGRRCFVPIGSDVGIITLEGLIPISKALPFNPAADRSIAFTNRVQNLMLQYAQDAYENFGWEAMLFPLETMLILNVPLNQNSQQVQLVMNTITGAWCQFTGWNANCFALFNNSLYFGDNSGNVNLAYVGNLDLISPIAGDLQCAFNFFGEGDNKTGVVNTGAGQIKQMTMLKPYIISNNVIVPSLSVNADFSTNSPSAPLTTTTAAGGTWDVSLWDASTWSAGTIAYANWQSVAALGTCFSARLKVNYGGSTSSLTGYGIFDVGTFGTAMFDGTGNVSASGENVPQLQIAEFLGLISGGGLI